MHTQVILLEDLKNLGKTGDVVRVRAGYARNYLFPQGMALPGSFKNMKRLDHEKRIAGFHRAKRSADAKAQVEKLQGIQIKIARKSGEQGKLFGSVTSQDVAEALAKQGVQIDKRKIILSDPLKALGDYDIQIRLGDDITGAVKVSVVAEA